MKNQTEVSGWGIVTKDGAEVWDAYPVFRHPKITTKDRLMLMFHPKKWQLYRDINTHFVRETKGVSERALVQEPFRVLDVGCGTGASMVDIKKMLGKFASVEGIDVVQLQVDIAKKRLKSYGIHPKVACYDGVHIDAADHTYDVIYTSDVLGHVEDVPAWLDELNRVLKPGGIIAMFSESKLGKHAYIRRYLLEKKGINVDPHQEFHISLYSKKELLGLFDQAGFDVEAMKGSFWAKFFVHPDELYPELQQATGVSALKWLNALLYRIKQAIHPFGAACAELYGLVEMILIGQWLETQGYVIRLRKRMLEDQ
jgi:ubiquinone/menaquinone biosynthesis C-methylase UbiE